jgi:prepilin-type N-terminal cleavage/methylation domain-containing protein
MVRLHRWASLHRSAREFGSARKFGSQGMPMGMTLVELLVVIAIVGVLTSLLLPAVQAAREAARQVACKNNLRQIGIALHTYQDAHRTLPAGCIEWRGWRSPTTNRQFAWSAMLLPFVEQQSLYASIDFSVPFDSVRNAAVARTRLSVYECPTAENRNLVRAQTDYGGLFGETMVDREQDDGVFLYDRSIRFSEITDGLSNTLAVSEDVGGPDSEWINGGNIFVQSGGINDPNAWAGDNEIRSKHGPGAMVLFVDGRTLWMAQSVDTITLGQLITRAKGEVISNERF